jgi:hypothetical protein
LNIISTFLIEATITNSVAMIPAILIVGYLAGSSLTKAGVNTYLRILIYCIFGVAAGLWSYSVYDAAGRSLEVIEAVLVALSMLVFSFVVVTPVVLLSDRRRRRRSTNGRDD